MIGGREGYGLRASWLQRVRRFLWAPREGGFTLIEVMVVFAVSGALFLMAAILIAGRQNQTAFDQSIRQIQGQIQQTINDVAVGYYPDRANFQCTATPTGVSLTDVPGGQGTNSGCIFLGKAMQFQVAGSDPEATTSFTITGLQLGGTGGAESSSLAEAKPQVVAPSITHNTANYPNNSVTDRLQNGLTTARMWYNNGGADVPIGAVAFVNSLGQYSNGALVSGAGQVLVIPIDTTTLGQSNAAAAEAINSDGSNRLALSPQNPSGGVFICFASGGTDQYGIVRIGGESRSLAVTLTIKNKNGAACAYP